MYWCDWSNIPHRGKRREISCRVYRCRNETLIFIHLASCRKATDAVKAALTYAQHTTGREPGIIYSDNAPEYLEKATIQAAITMGTRSEKAFPYIPEENVIAERLNGTFFEWGEMHHCHPTNARYILAIKSHQHSLQTGAAHTDRHGKIYRWGMATDKYDDQTCFYSNKWAICPNLNQEQNCRKDLLLYTI